MIRIEYELNLGKRLVKRETRHPLEAASTLLYVEESDTCTLKTFTTDTAAEREMTIEILGRLRRLGTPEHPERREPKNPRWRNPDWWHPR